MQLSTICFGQEVEISEYCEPSSHVFFWSVTVNSAKKVRFPALFHNPEVQDVSEVLSFSPRRAKLQLVGKAAVHIDSSVRAFSEKANSAFRATPYFLWLVRAIDAQKVHALLPDVSESRNLLSTHTLFVGFTCEWPLCATLKYRDSSLAPGSPAERGLSTSRPYITRSSASSQGTI